MIVSATPLHGVFEVTTTPSVDARGRFTRVFCEDELQAIRAGLHFAQVNLSSTSTRGTVRGMHFQQAPCADAKLIRCLRGRVLDVAVDLRAGSPTFLHAYATELAADGERQVFIPEGCAHGFQALEDDSQLLYLHTKPWSPAHDGRVNPADPRLGLRWPLPVALMSAADRDAPFLADTFAGLPA